MNITLSPFSTTLTCTCPLSFSLCPVMICFYLQTQLGLFTFPAWEDPTRPGTGVSRFLVLLGMKMCREYHQAQKDSYLSPAPESPSRLSCEVTSPVLGFPHSSSEQFCYRHWLCHKPSSSVHHRHCGELQSSDGPADPPGAGCLLVSLSESIKDGTLALTVAQWVGYLPTI